MENGGHQDLEHREAAFAIDVDCGFTGDLIRNFTAHRGVGQELSGAFLLRAVQVSDR